MSVIIPHLMVTCSLSIFVIFCVGMSVGAFSLVFFKYAWPQIGAGSFNEANCTVTSHNDVVLDCNHQSSGDRCHYYSTSINVRIQSGDEKWTGIAKKRKAHAFNSDFAANQWLNEHPINSTATCYYDPKDYSDIIYNNNGLTKDTTISLIIVSIWSGLILLIAGIISTVLITYYSLLCCRIIRWDDSDPVCNCWCIPKKFGDKCSDKCSNKCSDQDSYQCSDQTHYGHSFI